jgi:predicted small secreted protein
MMTSWKFLLSPVVFGIVILILTGCGTVGGAVSGAGSDLQRAGEWIKTR